MTEGPRQFLVGFLGGVVVGLLIAMAYVR